MAWGVDEIQGIALTIGGLIGQADRLAFDGNAPLTLNIHGVEQLVLKFTVSYHLTVLNNAICQGRLSMVYMGYYAEVSYFIHRVAFVDMLYGQGVFL